MKDENNANSIDTTPMKIFSTPAKKKAKKDKAMEKLLQCKYIWQYHLKMVFEACTNGVNYQLHKQLKASFWKMKEVDLSFSIKQWHGTSDKKTITDVDQIQVTLKVCTHIFTEKTQGQKVEPYTWMSLFQQ